MKRLCQVSKMIHHANRCTRRPHGIEMCAPHVRKPEWSFVHGAGCEYDRVVVGESVEDFPHAGAGVGGPHQPFMCAVGRVFDDVTDFLSQVFLADLILPEKACLGFTKNDDLQHSPQAGSIGDLGWKRNFLDLGATVLEDFGSLFHGGHCTRSCQGPQRGFHQGNRDVLQRHVLRGIVVLEGKDICKQL